MTCNAIYFKLILGISVTDYVGNWKRRRDNLDMNCAALSDTKIRCVWSNGYSGMYTVEGEKIQTIDGAVKGRLKGDTITWNTGNQWVRQGKWNIFICNSFSNYSIICS